MTDELNANELLVAARQAASHAHAPYSGFHVGAALLTDDGKIVTGCNVENASYGLTICAERIALTKAVSSGIRTFKAIAIVADGDKPPYPCGACRQVLAEFCDDDLPIYVACAARLDDVKSSTLGELLPNAFRF